MADGSRRAMVVVALGRMTANTAFERAVVQRGPRLARQGGRCAAAQLGR